MITNMDDATATLVESLLAFLATSNVKADARFGYSDRDNATTELVNDLRRFIRAEVRAMLAEV